MRAKILFLSLIITITALCITGVTPQAHAQLNPGDILVVDFSAGTNSRGALFSLDPVTGNRTVISDFGNASKGTLGVDPLGVVLGPSGNILVIDHGASTNFQGTLFGLNPANGNRVMISDFGDSLLGGNLHGLALVVSCGGKLQ